MKYPTQNDASNGDRAGTSEAEKTLRLIARLPAPDGLEDRVQAGLRSSRNSAGRVLEWPAVLRPAGNWMRTAAAAAIVCVVVGGGWGVYSRVQPAQSAKVIVMPPRVASPGGFSNASAMHVPNTLNGPILSNPASTTSAKPANAAPADAAQPKVVAAGAKKPVRRAALNGAKKVPAQSATAK